MRPRVLSVSHPQRRKNSTKLTSEYMESDSSTELSETEDIVYP